MNLRQKYKKAKRRIEMLEGKTSRLPVLKVEEYDVHKYVSEQFLPEEIKTYRTEQEIKEMLFTDIFGDIVQLADLEEVDRYEDRIRFVATLNIAVKRG